MCNPHSLGSSNGRNCTAPNKLMHLFLRVRCSFKRCCCLLLWSVRLPNSTSSDLGFPLSVLSKILCAIWPIIAWLIPKVRRSSRTEWSRSNQRRFLLYSPSFILWSFWSGRCWIVAGRKDRACWNWRTLHMPFLCCAYVLIGRSHSSF